MKTSMRNKVLAILLCAIMATTTLGTMAFAAEGGTYPSTAATVDVAAAGFIRVGDLNGDGRITQTDVDLLRSYIAGQGHTFPPAVRARIADGVGNISGNPTVGLMDFSMLRAYVEGRGHTLPPVVQARLSWHRRVGDLTGNGSITLEDVTLVWVYLWANNILPNYARARIAEGAGNIGGGPITQADMLHLDNYVMGRWHLLPLEVQARLSWHSGTFPLGS